METIHTAHTLTPAMTDHQGLCLILFVALVLALFVAMFDQIGSVDE